MIQRIRLTPNNNRLIGAYHSKADTVIVECDTTNSDFTVALPALGLCENVVFQFYNTIGLGTVTITGSVIDHIYSTVDLQAKGIVSIVDNLKGSWVTDFVRTGDAPPVDFIEFNTNLASNPTSTGMLYYDNHDKTLSVVLENATLQIGQESYIVCVNKTGSTILNGSVVYVSGAQGNRPKVSLAENTNYDHATCVIGVATHDIANNQEGMITTSGMVRDLNTSAFNEGDTLYLGSTPGSYTSSVPAYGSARVIIGLVAKEHVNDGWICVRVDNDKYMFGNVPAGNYTAFNSDGTMTNHGDATTFDDLLPNAVLTASTGPNAPSLTAFNGNLKAYEFLGTGATLKEIQVAWQTSHKITPDSSVLPHLHLHIPDNASGGTIKFYLEYEFASIGQTGAISTTTISGTVTRAANAGIANNAILAFPEVAGIGKSISSMFTCRIYRDPADAADTFAASVWLKGADLHINQNTLGSNTEYIK